MNIEFFAWYNLWVWIDGNDGSWNSIRNLIYFTLRNVVDGAVVFFWRNTTGPCSCEAWCFVSIVLPRRHIVILPIVNDIVFPELLPCINNHADDVFQVKGSHFWHVQFPHCKVIINLRRFNPFLFCFFLPWICVFVGECVDPVPVLGSARRFGFSKSSELPTSAFRKTGTISCSRPCITGFVARHRTFFKM